uniref:DUF1618 domain-containing protein n=1 Tax=Oryza glumipatula TaxID=40148 RepID=A0A0E0AK85_9ORYZ
MSDQECMEANHRLEEKIDMILEKLNEVEANRSKFFEEMSASIKATVAVLKDAPYPPPQDPPSSMLTTCSTMCSNNDHPRATSSSSHIDKETTPTVVLDLRDGEDKVHDPCIVTKDFLEVTLTMCSMKCSSPHTEPDLTMVAVVMCATTATTSTELVVFEDTTGVAYIDTPDYSKMVHAKCSTAGLDIDGGMDQAVVVFPIMKSVSKVVPISVEPLGIFSLRLTANLKQDRPTPTKCSMKKSSAQKHASKNAWGETMKLVPSTRSEIASRQEQFTELEVQIFWELGDGEQPGTFGEYSAEAAYANYWSINLLEVTRDGILIEAIYWTLALGVITWKVISDAVLIGAGKGTWTPDSCSMPFVRVIDIAFFKDKLYLITTAEDLFAVDLAADKHGKPTVTNVERIIRQPRSPDGMIDAFRWSDDEDDDGDASSTNDDGEYSSVDDERVVDGEDHDEVFNQEGGDREIVPVSDDNDIDDVGQQWNLTWKHRKYEEFYEEEYASIGTWHLLESCDRLHMVRREWVLPFILQTDHTRKLDVFEADMDAGVWVPVTGGLVAKQSSSANSSASPWLRLHTVRLKRTRFISSIHTTCGT